MQALVDQIYEAALIPDIWEKTLCDMAEQLGANSAAMLIIDPNLPPLWAATPNNHEALSMFAGSPAWYDNKRLNRLARASHAGFLRVGDFSTREELAADYPNADAARAHMAAQVGTVMAMPDGSQVLFTFERTLEMGGFDPAELVGLDDLRRHLARASLLSMRLQMQRADASVATLEALGLPAAVVNGNGVAMAVNPLFEAHAKFLRPAAFGRLSLVNRDSNALLQAALIAASYTASVQSIPVPAETDGDAPAVVHVLPLRRSARDVFDSGGVLVVITSYSVEGNAPPDAVLRGLFDLSAAEAKLAGSLAEGLSVAEAASQRGISLPTARSQLAQVFRKTGTSQQSELIALLKGSHAVATKGAF